MTRIKQVGFTLIELIVTVSIIIILSGMSLAAYFKFSQNQSSVNDARGFSTLLRKVQSMAKNLVYPVGCIGLSGYRVADNCSGVYGKDCQSVKYSAVCSGLDYPVSSNEKVFIDAYFTGHVDTFFLAGSGKVAAIQIFPISNMNGLVVSVDETGNIITK